MKKVELKYRTFDELLSEVSLDFRMFATEGLIEPAQLVKVVQRINYDLGLKIHQTKDAILEVEHRKVRLPVDFHSINYAFICGRYKTIETVPMGIQSEDVLLTDCTRCGEPDPECICEKTFTTTCGDHYKVVHKIKHQIREYEYFEPVRTSHRSGKPCAFEISKIEGGFAFMNVDCGTLYINYEGILEDEEGNLLVLDNPLVNEYYEYGLKLRILENLYYSGEDVERKMMFTEQRYKTARTNALSMVNMPDYNELKGIWRANRKAFSIRYIDMFKSS